MGAVDYVKEEVQEADVFGECISGAWALSTAAPLLDCDHCEWQQIPKTPRQE